MNKVYIILVFSVVVFTACNTSSGQTKEDTPNEDFKKIYPLALRGELTKVFTILDTINEKHLNTKEKNIRKKYYDRFISETETYDYKTTDPRIIEFVSYFQTYWKSVVLDKQTIATADTLFEKWAADFLFQTHFKDKTISTEAIQNDLYTYANEFLSDLGYFSNAFGKTAQLYDLFLWKTEEVEEYPVQLIEDSVTVPVHFMKDFIVTGWSHYTTFGRNYASGWTTSEALFAVDTAYDRESESFKISYLMHEGQHFSDTKKYPKLKQADLEYRAKLVELVTSKETTHIIVEKFIFNAVKEKGNAHGFANYCVVRDLSRLIFASAIVTEKEKWATIPSQTVQEQSAILFKEHSLQLNKVGSDTVTELIDF